MRMRDMPEYHAWYSMIQRCTNPNNKSYRNYGMRGITVCDRWRHSFELFVADMNLRPSRFHSLDRIDNDKGYFPGNCRWATDRQQRRNRQDNVVLTHEGKSRIVSDWAREIGLSEFTLRKRIRMGWKTEDVLDPRKRHNTSRTGYRASELVTPAPTPSR